MAVKNQPSAFSPKWRVDNFLEDLKGKKEYKRFGEAQDRKRRVVGQALLILSIAAGSIYLGWLYSRLNLDVWYFSIPFAFAETVMLAAVAICGLIIWYPRFHHPEGIKQTNKYSVDIFITTRGEPLELLEKTVAAACNIDYPDKKISILDDGSSKLVRALALCYSCNYFSRAEARDAKAGNLNHALDRTKKELILSLDADQVPDPDILQRMTGFFNIATIGIVQSRQRFAVPEGDPFGNTDEFFYRVMQPAKDNDNAAFSCGSGVLYRRAALESIGGFSTWNLVEDVHTSMRLHENGWKSVYFDHATTTGTAPADMVSVSKQRLQWATDSLRIFFWDNPWKKEGLSFEQKLQYWHLGFNYIVSGFVMPIFFMLPAYMLFTGTPIFYSNASSYFLYRGVYFLLTMATWLVMQYPVDAAKYYKIWIGLCPTFAKATWKALASGSRKPVYHVNAKPAQNGEVKNEAGWLRQFQAVWLQAALFVANFSAIFYAIFNDTLRPDLLIVCSLWAIWVMWSLGGICKAALWPKKWAAPTPAKPSLQAA